MNWKQLKDFCNSIPEEFLDRKVILWREDEAINQIEAEALEHDQYVDAEYPELGCFDETEMDSQIKHNQELTRDDFRKVYEKGFPVLKEKF